MFQGVSQLLRMREQDISDFVLVQNILRIVDSDQIEIIAKHACILKNIDAAVDKNLHVWFIQGQVAAPDEIIQNASRWWMSPQVRQDLCGILLWYFIEHFCLAPTWYA